MSTMNQRNYLIRLFIEKKFNNLYHFLYLTMGNLFHRVKDKKEELMPWQKTKILKSRVSQDQQLIPDPSESSVHGKEVHVAKQKQTQKEVSIYL